MRWTSKRTVTTWTGSGVSCSALLGLVLLLAACAAFPPYQPATQSVQPAASPMATVARLTAALSRHAWRAHFQVPLQDGSIALCQYRDNRDTRVFTGATLTEGTTTLELKCDAPSAAKQPVTIKWVSTPQTRQAFQKQYGGYSEEATHYQWAKNAAYYLYQLSLVPAEAPGAFEAQAQTYRAAATKPELPESAREYKVRAESAVSEKRFLDAVEAYDRALQVAPWWPQGHFNVALVLGELKTYGLAAEEMQRYLTLVPDAANARQAQDKIYAWRGKLEKPY